MNAKKQNVIHVYPAEGSIQLALRDDAAGQETVAQCLWLSGQLVAPALCSGMGRCGQCRVRFRADAPEALPVEHEVLGATVQQGWRLACRHPVLAGMEIEVPASTVSATRVKKNGEPCFLAVDLGTTSLQWKAFAVEHSQTGRAGEAGAGHFCQTGQAINPQMGAGSDVMSRIAFARTQYGRERLQQLVRQSLARLLASLDAPVQELCVAANPAMTALLLGLDCQGLAAAPYTLPLAGGSAYILDGLPQLWIPPQIAPFVGGDISAGFAAVLHDYQPRYPFLLVDMGTNGEFVYALSPQRALVTSVPLGPALEGIGLSCGMNAQTGAVHQVRLSPQGLELRTLDTTPPQGLCGTGYLSLLLALRSVGLVDDAGHFCPATHPLAQRIARFDPRHPQRLLLGHGLFLDAHDVEELIKVKAAFALAVENLLAYAAASWGRSKNEQRVQAVYLAGALGQHLPDGALAGLGFLPSALAGRAIGIGNSALRGAEILLQKPELRAGLSAWAHGCTCLDLTALPDFMQGYARQMRFSYRAQGESSTL